MSECARIRAAGQLREVISAAGGKSGRIRIQGTTTRERQSDKMNENAGSAGSVTVERGRGDAGCIVVQSDEGAAIPDWARLGGAKPQTAIVMVRA
jgi:hypothetical protein